MVGKKQEVHHMEIKALICPTLPTIHHKLLTVLIIDVIKSLQKGPLCMITRMSIQNVCSCYHTTIHYVQIDFKMYTW